MRSILKLITIFLFFAGVYPAAHATIYLNLDAENGTVGSTVPNPPFCQTQCSGSGEPATYQSNGGAAQGTNYFQWHTVDNQLEHYTVIRNTQTNNLLGKTIYLAYYFRFDRINSNDIWRVGTGTQSADKGVELTGNGIRWILARGQWDKCNNGGFASNQAHRFTIWAGNPSYHLNPELEAYGTNQNGYSCSNPMQLEYERWYSAVVAVNFAADNSGSITVYIDGVRVIDYQNIQTAANNTPTIDAIHLGGTMAQPAYNSPSHYRKFDAFMLTDNWQDIIDGGYLRGITMPKAPVAY
jgi:hypothetical protein